MVVLSAAVLTKPGKVLVSRQFMPITKSRIEGLWTAFPKLVVGGDASHTFIETEAIRYVYQPLDQLYVVLITNKQSNIIEDLDTLRLLSKLVVEVCGANTEEAVKQRPFQLTFAFDEVVSLGVKENVTLANIKTNLAMDSHEEKLQKIIMESKMTEAREEARRKAEAIEKQKAEMRAKMQAEGKLIGFGSSSYPGGGTGSDSYQSHGGGGGGGGGGGSMGYNSPPPVTSPSSSSSSSAAQSKQPESKKGPPVKGMSLGKAAKKQDDFVSAINKEEAATRVGPVPARVLAANQAAAQKEAEKAAAAKAAKRLQVLVEEKIQVVMDKEGGIKKVEVQGGIRVVVQDPDESKIVIRTSGAPKNPAVKCRLHPNIDSKAFGDSGTIVNKDVSKAYAVGSDNASIVCKWRLQSQAESDVPLHVNLWDNVDKGRSIVSVDFKAGGDAPAAGRPAPFTLSDVHIVVPCRSKAAPEVTSKEGHVTFDNKEKVVMWSLDEVGPSHRTGQLEFSVPELDGDSFFPLNIMFSSAQTFAGIQITGVNDAESGKPIEFTTSTSLTVDKFTIERE